MFKPNLTGIIKAEVNPRCLQTLSKQDIIPLQWKDQGYVIPDVRLRERILLRYNINVLS
jgi:hypothetical protein